MRANVRRAGVLVCAALAACAPTVRRDGQSSAATALPAEVPRAAAPPASASADAALDASMVREGYHVDRRGEQVRYCRTQVTTGTAFSSTVCLTPEQVQAQRRSLQQSQDSLVQPRGITCTGKVCSGG